MQFHVTAVYKPLHERRLLGRQEQVSREMLLDGSKTVQQASAALHLNIAK